MKIYSWNVWFENKDLDRAFAFIQENDFDIFCLQEVPRRLLEKLKTLPSFIAYAPEVDRLYKGVTETQYIVILSRFPLGNVRPVPLIRYEEFLPLRTRLAVRFMTHIGIWGYGMGNRHAIVVEVETPVGLLNLCNMHLPLIAPKKRAEEFESILARTDDSLPTVVCGDFNILESRRISILNWVLGGMVSDAVLSRRERSTMEKRFSELKLTNPLLGANTHRFSHSQLDHILVPAHATVKNSHVFPDSYGSDHQPIITEIELHASLTA